MHGLRESINDKSEIKNNSKYINEDQPEKQAMTMLLITLNKL